VADGLAQVIDLVPKLLSAWPSALASSKIETHPPAAVGRK